MGRYVKISGLCAIAGAFIYFMCYKYVDDFHIQAGFLCTVSVLAVVKTSFKAFWGQLKVFFMFVLFMGLFYAGFGLMGLSGKSFEFWAFYGANRIFLFISTVILFSLIMSFIHMDDIISLPFKIHHLKYLILGNFLFLNAQKSMKKIDFFVELFPEYQTQAQKGIKKQFYKNLMEVLALIFFIIRESEIQGELIDNRISHCFNGKDAA